MRHALVVPAIGAVALAGLAAVEPAHAQDRPDGDKPAAPAPVAPAAGDAKAADRDKAAAPAGAAAKDAPAAAGAASAGAQVKVERTSTGAKLFRITDGMLVEGQMQKPNAFYVLQRAAIDYDFEALSESFLPRIHAATKKPPF